MSTDPELSPPLSYEPPAPRRLRATAVLAWAVIVGVCVLLPVLRASKHSAIAVTPTTVPASAPAAPASAPAAPASRPVDAASGEVSNAAAGKAAGEAVDFQTAIAGRFWVGAVRLSAADGDSAEGKRLESVIGLQADTPMHKVVSAIVLAEVGRTPRAIELLQKSDDPAAGELLALYHAGPAATTRPAATNHSAATTGATTPVATTPPLSTATLKRFGWFGRLADVYGRPDADAARAAVLAEAKHTVVVTMTAFGVAIGAGVLGLGLFVTAIVLAATGRLRVATKRPTGPAHVYVEAVAIYLGGFVVVSVLIGLFLPDAPLWVEIAGLGGVVVLAALWPLARGVALRDLRQDWGVHTGRGVLKEMLAGVGGYLAGLPVIAVGLLVMVVLLAATHADPSHPIVKQADDHSVAAVLGLYALASVFAPLTEELMFRGALVSHLRAGVGVAIAAAVSGLVFAAVHPQGWAVVPALMSVGAVLAVVRQWRGSLIASVTAHALHNGFLITVMTLATR